ncbi:MAG: hypothetical protein K0S34_2341 [Bacillales bacterium]|nr:hypothetical protein [Bacillales bacterium]
MTTGWNLDNSYTRLPDTFFSKTNPTRVSSPKIIIYNEQLATGLGLNNIDVDILAGNKLPEGAHPIAQTYAGHQFGHFTMLGDGRAILLGEQITPHGERKDIQLKGSGRTPYSRGGDGRASLGPMLREYIISEAMNALGIPTTRSLAVVTTGESVFRETELPGAILTRVATSHIRVGTFQFAAKWGTKKDLQMLADYTIERHFPNVQNSDNPYLSLLNEVVKRQASLIAKWQLVGFIHGVMNTDNVTISGETIDYGPCAFMDTYDPETVFSSIDIHGRYAYKNQPQIGMWNLARFAETLLPLIHDNQDEAVIIAQNAITKFDELYEQNWITGMRAKLGLFDEDIKDEALIKELLDMMQQSRSDYTNTFIALTFDKLEETNLINESGFKEWNEQWQSRFNNQKAPREDIHELMKKNNPAVIPRNHRVEEALNAAVKNGDFSVMEKFLNVLSSPYSHNTDQAEFAALPPQQNCSYRTFCGT